MTERFTMHDSVVAVPATIDTLDTPSAVRAECSPSYNAFLENQEETPGNQDIENKNKSDRKPAKHNTSTGPSESLVYCDGRFIAGPDRCPFYGCLGLVVIPGCLYIARMCAQFLVGNFYINFAVEYHISSCT